MKRLNLLLLGLLFIGIACTFSTAGGTGSKVDRLLADPPVGLDALSDYYAELTISFAGTANGGVVNATETYTQSEWPALAAKFTTFEPIDENGQPWFVLTGDVGAAHYTQEGKNDDCMVRWEPEAEADSSSQIVLASFLIPVAAAQTAGEETVGAISARRYTFDGESLGLPEEAKAGGEVWIAIQGGYVVKYTLQIEGGDSYFGSGTQGTQRIEYLLSEVGTRPEVVYPAGCKPVLADVPAMDDAADIIRLPGFLDYASKSPVDAITAFYADYFKSGGWEQVGDNRFADERAVMIFGRGDAEDIALVVVRKEADAQRVTVSLFGEEIEGTSTPEPGSTLEAGSGDNPALRVANGLSILLGMDEDHPAPPSFHLEAFHKAPTWEEDGVVYYEDRMTADVQGENIHFIDLVSAPDGTITEAEAYLIGELEYDVESGVLQPAGTSMTKLAWVLWPLDPSSILGTCASSATAAGTEMLDGRMAEIYDVDESGAMGAAGTSLNITAVKGRVWIDQETGALLKAELDYQADVKDADGKIMENAAGRLEITVTKVGKVTVTLPAQ